MTRAWLLRRLVGDGRRHGLAWLALVAAFGVVGFSAAGARLVARAAMPVAAPGVRVIAYLEDDLDAPGVAALERALAKLPGVEAVRVVSAREGLELLRGALGPRAAVIEGVGPDLLSPSLELLARPALAEALAFRLRRLRGVAGVDLVAAPPPPGPGDGPLRSRFLFAPGAALGGLGLLAAFAFLRARLRVELALWFALGLPRGASARPAVWLAMAAAGLGAALGGFAVSWSARSWLELGTLPLRELALGAASLLVLAFVASRVALRIPEAAGAR
ncbi:MAG TPA: permease-like cell division protein FtsX [Polyangia bacterium]